MSDYVLTLCRASKRTASKFVSIAGLFMIFAHLIAWSQQPKISSDKDTLLIHSTTPREVMTGSAKLVQSYDPASKLRLAIGINPPHMAAEEAFLKELQDKNSPNFHKYLTPEQWNKRFAPSELDEQAVVDWAKSQGLSITSRYPNRLMVNVEGTVENIQKALRVTINKYEVNGQVEFSNDRDPIIPANLSHIIGSVDGLNSIQRMRPARPGTKGVRGPDYSPGPLRQEGPATHGDSKEPQAKALTGAELRGKLPKVSLTPGQSGGQITNGFYDPTDIFNSNAYDYDALQALGHCCNPNHDASGAPVETSIGLATDGDFRDSDWLGFHNQYPYLAWNYHRVWVGGTPFCCSDEATLDMEWSIATSNSRGSYLDTAQVWVYEAANGFGDFGTLYQQMLNDNHVRVVNISYGLAEYSGLSDSVMNSWHAIFNQMVGQGWTIMAASGDGGASTGCGSSLATIYPGSDPDIVSVGGSQLGLNSDGTFSSEVAWTGDNSSGSCSVNDGGSGGGCSAKWSAPGYQTSAGYQSAPYCGAGSRSVPDIALNASAHSGQNYYFNGALSGVAGTSIASPMMSGFIAQANAYLLAIGLGGAPLGEVDYKIYWLASHPGSSYEAHYPFYDITSGCNSNDDTNYWGIGSYCAGTGYDAVTGWGSFNALQLAWGFNTYDLGDFGAPVVTFSGPSVSHTSNTWYNTDQTVSWTVTDTGGGYPATGVSGFTQAWDAPVSDPVSEATPGSGNAFYSGPEFANATSGYLLLSWAGQGCHYATVDAWDNSGITSGNQYYYWICYDTVAPTIATANSPAANSHGWNKQAVTVSLTAADPGGSAASGIKAEYYAIDTGACTPGTLGSCFVYSGPFTITAQGWHYIYYFTQDNAGNFSPEPYEWVYIDETTPVTSATLAGTLYGAAYDSAVTVTLHATDSLSGVLATYYSLDGGALTTYTSPLTVSVLGSHTVKFYSVDNAGNTETTRIVAFTITAKTATTLTSSPDPSVNGQSVTLHATVVASPSGTPIGTVTFKNGATTLGTSTLLGGVASFSTANLPVGTDALTATYAGGTNFIGSTSVTVSQVVHESTSTTITSSLNPAVCGQTVVFTAKVKPSISGVPTGIVNFYDGPTVIGSATLSGGLATFSTHALAAGSHTMIAFYLGDSTYTASHSVALAESITKAVTTTTVASSLNPSVYPQSVTFTAKVTSPTGVPIGAVTFFAGGVSIGSATLSGGVANLATTSLAVGTHVITATYAGTVNFNASTSSALSEVTNAAKTTTIVVSSLNPSTHGLNVTFKATVTPATSGIPTGAVTFKDGTTTIGTASLIGGTASITTNTLPVGTDSITVVYGGSVDYLGSTSPVLSQVVH